MSRPRVPQITKHALHQLGEWSGIFGDKLLDAVLELAERESSGAISPELVQRAVVVACDQVKANASVLPMEPTRNVKPAAA